MLKFFFAMLLLANAALFAWQRGWLPSGEPELHEPARAARQLNADRIRVLPATAEKTGQAGEGAAPSAAAATASAAASTAAASTAASTAAASAPAAPTAAPAATAALPVEKVAAKASEPSSCLEIGGFDVDEAKRFEQGIAPLGLGDRVAKRELDEPSRYIVHIPPQQNKEGADRKAGELRKLGVREFYVIQDSGDLKWGISLGIFRTEEAARAHLASLNQKGVRSAKIAPYSAAPHKVGYQLRNLDAAARAKVEKIRADFPQQQSRECAPAA